MKKTAKKGIKCSDLANKYFPIYCERVQGIKKGEGGENQPSPTEGVRKQIYKDFMSLST